MTIYNIYIFNKEGTCIYYKHWKREKQSGISQAEEFKLMFGMLHSLQSFAERMSIKEGNQLVKFYRTSTYKLNYMELETGLKIVVNTDPNAVGANELLRSIYQAFVDTIIRNPLLDTIQPLSSELFEIRLDQIVSRHPAFEA